MPNITSLTIGNNILQIAPKVISLEGISVNHNKISLNDANSEYAEFDVSNILPEDNYSYLVNVSAEILLPKSLPNGYVGCIAINGTNYNTVRICGGTKVAGTNIDEYYSGTGMILVNSERKIYLSRYSGWYGNINQLKLNYCIKCQN